MLRDRVLPSGIGTHNQLLPAGGGDGRRRGLPNHRGIHERRSVATVNQLLTPAHGPHPGFWQPGQSVLPKSRCALLRDDLVLMDSPGTDVTLELDSWIDKFCVWTLMSSSGGNAESTLMNTMGRLSDRAEYIDEVRKQHLDRCVSFLAEELRVVGLDEAPGGSSSSQPKSGALAEGFHDRLREFQRFERTFEEFISQSAVKTKFEQHTVRAWQITEAIKTVMDAINIASADRRAGEQRDRLDFVRGQINPSDGQRQGQDQDSDRGRRCKALSDQIRSLPIVTVSVLCCLCPSRSSSPAPSSSFELTYDLGLAALCADFQENIEFQFSLGWTPSHPLHWSRHAKRALSARPCLVSVTSRASMTVLVMVEWCGVQWAGVSSLSLSLYGLSTCMRNSPGGCQQGARSEEAVHGARCPPPESRRPRHRSLAASRCTGAASTFSRLTQRVDLSEAELEETSDSSASGSRGWRTSRGGPRPSVPAVTVARPAPCHAHRASSSHSSGGHLQLHLREEPSLTNIHHLSTDRK
ncbi:hypothetical protein INR49_027209 [Caranx melampygus]|nr:hypothetical protein INR49_027209 [Caranx melampygus]